MDARAAAARAIAQLLRQQGSLASALPPLLPKVKAKDRGLVQELCYGSLRYFHRLNYGLQPLLQKPLGAKDQDIQALLLIGAYQLEYSRIPPHAAVASCVEACRGLGKNWATKLVNGVLRNYQRKLPLELPAEQPWLSSSHPKWLYKQLQQAWPEQFEDILDNNNQHPSFSLRVNRRWGSRAQYLNLLEQANIEAKACEFAADGITLSQACAVEVLPGFSQGWASVQDEAAQLAAELMELQPGQRILDACCAPGGKTCHILEREPSSQVLAIDLEPKRLARVQENLERLQLKAELVTADASSDSWWDGQQFDRILLDAPCSATGVIRRHPDIKILRKPANIDELVTLQGQILRALWPKLKPGGILVYATCSVLPAENEAQVERFLEAEASAEAMPIKANWGLAQTFGRQLFPRAGGGDGFYYARMQKIK
ncbi:MAG: 16S rRNA (cytosine(967)-C(5))-methyltransferase RsmB [Cellvibrionaceae bacterium]|nr:16S rRNA (cytosine(967)-C(5))-methyltransferase RsmB [Cellvibrionaceae bacterium]MCV6626978.1 16S rRNA (cytosine(967)-C(5))-methyltransferase RsmB [Cellvibrionaceae bacterium]